MPSVPSVPSPAAPAALLTRLTLTNFVLFEAAELELGPGLNVISGGSGEGKSLLLQAVRFACGEGPGGRAAAARWVRPGAETCAAELTFAVGPATRVALGLPAGEGSGELRLARAMGRDGKGRCAIDGRPVSAQELRRVGQALVEAFGQGAAAGLVEPGRQREVLDGCAGQGAALASYRLRRAAALALSEEVARLGALEERARAGWAEGRSEREALRELAPEPGEYAARCAELERLEERERERATVAALCARLDGDDVRGGREALLDGLYAAARELERVTPRWPELAEASAALADAAALVDEAARHVRGAHEDAAGADGALEEARARVQAYRALARRLRTTPETLAARLEELEAEGDPAALAERRAVAERRLRAERKALLAAAQALLAGRRRAAEELAAAVAAALPPLGLAGASFVVAVTEALPAADALPGPDGCDEVAFRFAAGGAAPAPLEQASGGELSRLALALGARVSAGRAVLLFDEVDQNVGARLGAAVGTCLADLAEGRQVLAVTHLAPVAARAAHHLRIVREGERTRAEPLVGEARLQELALMIRGEPITAAALEQARELLSESPGRPRTRAKRAAARGDRPARGKKRARVA